MGLVEIKQALQNDEKFRKLFPEYADEIKEFLKNPSCNCYGGLLKKVKSHPDRLSGYTLKVKIVLPEVDEPFEVINCKVDELEKRLKKYSRGHFNIALARYEDEITVVIRRS